MPTQPTRRSPKCTLPSRPPVMPPARPMYWREDARRRDAADQVRREVAVQDAEPVVAVHRPGRPGRDGLLAEAVVEGARHLALAVEHHRPLLDAAHPSIARRSPVRSSSVRCSLDGRWYVGLRTSAVSVAIRRIHSFLVGHDPGSAGAPLCWPPARDRRRGSCRVGSKVTLRGVEHSERLWLARLRWRMRGAWLWPAFFALTALDGALIALLPPYDGSAARAGRRRAAGGLRQPHRGRRARRRWSGACCAAGGPTCRASSRTTTPARAARASRSRSALLAAGLAHRPAVVAERGDEAAVVRRGARLRRRPGRRMAAGPAAARRAAPRARGLPGLRAGRGPAPLALPDRRHRPAPGGRVARQLDGAEQRLRTVGGFR